MITEEQVAMIVKRCVELGRERARERFNIGLYDSPYNEFPLDLGGFLAQVMFCGYQAGMELLLNQRQERTCPCCGQSSRMDFDW